MIYFNALEALPYRYGHPPAQCRFKDVPQDFVVEEVLGYAPADDERGEHWWFWVEKTGANTQYVAKEMARQLSRPLADISYAGLKDRQAVTRQWFSARCPGLQSAPQLNIADSQCLQVKRCRAKLKRGALAANQFQIRLRNVSDVASVVERFTQIAQQGVPNYFGSQRFGIGAGNLLAAKQWQQRRYRPKSRNEKAFLISAMRAWLFNQQVAERLLGDEGLEGFGYLLGRMQFDAPLEWQNFLSRYAEEQQWLAKLGCQFQKRPLQLALGEPSIEVEQADVILAFTLPAGSYATAVLRELVITHEPAIHK